MATAFFIQADSAAFPIPSVERYFVYDPNGVPVGNVYTDWAAMLGVVGVLPTGEQPTIAVVAVTGSTPGAPTVFSVPLAGMPATGWDMHSATLTGVNVTQSGALILDIPAGVRLDNLLEIGILLFLRTNNLMADPPALNFSDNPAPLNKTFFISRGSSVLTTGDGALIETAGGGDSVSVVLLTGCALGAFFAPPLVGPIVRLGAGDTAIAVQLSTLGGFPVGWLEGPGTASVGVLTDSSGTVPSEWGPAFLGTVSFISFQDRNGLRGTTAERPTAGPILVGMIFFDTDLGFPIWWNGLIWVDAAGAPA